MARLFCLHAVAIVLCTFGVAADEKYLEVCDGPHCEDENPSNSLQLLQTQLRLPPNMTAQLSTAARREGACEGEFQQLPNGCDKDVLTVDNSVLCLPKVADFWGVTMRGTANLPEWAWIYAQNVFAKYIDSDGDGKPDDPTMLEQLKREKGNHEHGGINPSFMALAVENCEGEIGTGNLRKYPFGIVSLGGEEEAGFRPKVLKAWHRAIFRAYEQAYPTVFLGQKSSELGQAIVASFGNCETSAVCAPNCQHYECSSSDHCSFIKHSCSGAYHSADISCSQGFTCLAAEGFWHGWSTANGYNCGSTPTGSPSLSEWEVCSATEMERNAQTKPLYELVTNQAASQKELGYKLPTVIPDGQYTARQVAAGCGSGVVCTTQKPWQHRPLEEACKNLIRNSWIVKMFDACPIVEGNDNCRNLFCNYVFSSHFGEEDNCHEQFALYCNNE